MGFWGDPMNSGAGNRSREGKVERGLKVFPTTVGSGANVKAEQKRAAQLARKAKRKANREAKVKKGFWS